MTDKENMDEAIDVAGWLSRVAREHMRDRGLTTLQCGRKVFGVDVSFEVFYDDGHGLLVLTFDGGGRCEQRVSLHAGHDGDDDEQDYWAAAVCASGLAAVMSMTEQAAFIASIEKVAIGLELFPAPCEPGGPSNRL